MEKISLPSGANETNSSGVLSVKLHKNGSEKRLVIVSKSKIFSLPLYNCENKRANESACNNSIYPYCVWSSMYRMCHFVNSTPNITTRFVVKESSLPDIEIQLATKLSSENSRESLVNSIRIFVAIGFFLLSVFIAFFMGILFSFRQLKSYTDCEIQKTQQHFGQEYSEKLRDEVTKSPHSKLDLFRSAGKLFKEKRGKSCLKWCQEHTAKPLCIVSSLTSASDTQTGADSLSTSNTSLSKKSIASSVLTDPRYVYVLNIDTGSNNNNNNNNNSNSNSNKHTTNPIDNYNLNCNYNYKSAHEHYAELSTCANSGGRQIANLSRSLSVNNPNYSVSSISQASSKIYSSLQRNVNTNRNEGISNKYYI